MFNAKRILAIVLILVSVPVIIDLLMFTPSTSLDKGTVDTWISFFGSYSGGIIGGIATIVGIKLTLDYTKQKDEDEKRRNILPYIQVMEGYNEKYVDFIAEEILINGTKYSYLLLKNVGLGSAIDIKFDFKIKEYMYIYNPEKSIALSVNDLEYVYIRVPSSLLNSKEYEASIKFRDLLGNSYVQDVVFLDRGADPMSIIRTTSPKLENDI